MSLNHTASILTPLLLRSGARALPRSASRTFPRQLPAIAILVPHLRASSTDTSHRGGAGGANYPPPGFNVDEARKPLKPEEQKAKKGEDSVSKSSKDERQTSTSGHPAASSEPKTAAAEQQALNELATEKAVEDQAEEKKIAKKKEGDKKLTIWQKVKREASHYWDGTKLLATEVKISMKLAMKMAAGYELTRRENRQLQRTVKDLGRLVPFSVFVIVPFAELLLPIALRLFPNMLPSTYEGQKAKDAKASGLRTTRTQVSSFLRQTLKETGLPLSAANAKREEFAEFFRKVRTTGESPSKADIIKVCKLFKDDLTLDNLSRPQLVGICRYMNLNSFGTDNMLRYQIRHRMRQIKRDDKAIAFEGVDSLSVTELHNACASRGLRTHGMSPGRLRDDLQMWLDLRLKYGVPSTLLVLSNAFMYAQGKETEFESQLDAVQAVLSSIPEELFHEIELEVHNAEGAATNRQRLEVLREQQELIEEENEQQSAGGEAKSAPKDDEDIDEKEEQHHHQQQQQDDSMQASSSPKGPQDSEAQREQAKEQAEKEGEQAGRAEEEQQQQQQQAKAKQNNKKP